MAPKRTNAARSTSNTITTPTATSTATGTADLGAPSTGASAAQHEPIGTPSVTAVSSTYGTSPRTLGSTGFGTSIHTLWSDYTQSTPKQLKLLDAFQLFLMLTGVAQFVYCIAVTNFPFNAFLGGFSATVGQFVLAASLRSQVNPKNRAVFPTISPERAFADFAFGSLVLHFFVYNYLG